MLIVYALLTLAAPTRVEVTADNSIVIYPGEEHLNAGGQTRIRIKGNQHLVAMAFDAAPLAGRKIAEATLVCTKADETIDAVTLSTIAAPWDEHKSNALTSGALAYDGWGWPGSRFTDLTGSNSFTLTCQAPSDLYDGAYHWRVDPDLIHAMAIGAALGLTIHEVSSNYGRNPTICSKEQRAQRPHLLVSYGGDEPEPQPATRLRVTDGRDLQTRRLRLTAPAHGFAYEVKVNGRELPRWNVPFVQPGAEQVIPLRDVSLQSGGGVKVDVVTLSRTGRRSAPASVAATLPRSSPLPEIEVPALPASPPSDLSVIPVLDKYRADGRPVGDLPDDYLHHNELFDGRTIRLTAAKGEVVGFQALLKGTGATPLSCELPGLRTELWQALYVDSKAGRIPDPLLPIDRVALQPNEATPVVADIYVPFDQPAGRLTGSFAVGSRSVPLELDVLPVAIPRRASFLCEMNSYGLPDRLSEFYAIQQLAYDHRVHANILYYHHSTAAPGARKCVLDKLLDFGPNATGRRMDEARFNAIQPGATTTFWDDFVTAFDPYLSGECFRGGHRGVIPAPGFYLPFHESWPLNVRAFWNGDLDAYRAFTEHPEYTATFQSLVRDFIRLAKQHGWTDTGFQIYLNNKGAPDDPKKNPWVLDEPSGYYDYRALAYYADLVQQAKGTACPIRLDYRIDISRPQFDRGELWGKSDLWVVNMGSMRNHPRLVADRRERSGEQLWVYGTSNPVEESNRTIEAWVLEAFGLGASGLVPWQTIDQTGQALTKADQLGLFIFDQQPDGKQLIRPTLRLKAYREAEQTIELLLLVQQQLGLTDAQLREFVNRYVPLAGSTKTASAEDAGTAEYGRLEPEAFRRLRTAAIEVLRG